MRQMQEDWQYCLFCAQPAEVTWGAAVKWLQQQARQGVWPHPTAPSSHCMPYLAPAHHGHVVMGQQGVGPHPTAPSSHCTPYLAPAHHGHVVMGQQGVGPHPTAPFKSLHALPCPCPSWSCSNGAARSLTPPHCSLQVTARLTLPLPTMAM